MTALTLTRTVNSAMPDTPTCLAPGCGKLLVGGRADRRYCGRTCTNRAYKAKKRTGESTTRPVADVLPMSDFDLGWLVGIVEGEGSFTQHRSRYGDREYRYPVLAVSMTDEDLVRRCHTLTGVGRLWGPLSPPSRKDNKPSWAWHVQGEAAGKLIPLLIPHLGERRRARAEKVLEEWENRNA